MSITLVLPQSANGCFTEGKEEEELPAAGRLVGPMTSARGRKKQDRGAIGRAAKQREERTTCCQPVTLTDVVWCLVFKEGHMSTTVVSCFV